MFFKPLPFVFLSLFFCNSGISQAQQKNIIAYDVETKRKSIWQSQDLKTSNLSDRTSLFKGIYSVITSN
jgi:hypothetical protein